MTDEIKRILRSMWHRGRKEYVLWTSQEIDDRANVCQDDRCAAAKMGLIKATGKDRNRAYYITPLGIAAHASMM